MLERITGVVAAASCVARFGPTTPKQIDPKLLRSIRRILSRSALFCWTHHSDLRLGLSSDGPEPSIGLHGSFQRIRSGTKLRLR
jgi:hypothetical protein